MGEECRFGAEITGRLTCNSHPGAGSHPALCSHAAEALRAVAEAAMMYFVAIDRGSDLEGESKAEQKLREALAAVGRRE